MQQASVTVDTPSAATNRQPCRQLGGKSRIKADVWPIREKVRTHRIELKSLPERVATHRVSIEITLLEDRKARESIQQGY